MKKLLSIFITASLVLSFAAPVMADENKITPEEVEAFIWSDPLSNHAECDTLMNMVFYQPEDVTAQESIKDKACLLYTSFHQGRSFLYFLHNFFRRVLDFRCRTDETPPTAYFVYSEWCVLFVAT